MIGIKEIFFLVILLEMTRRHRYLHGYITQLQRRLNLTTMIRQEYCMSTTEMDLSQLHLEEQWRLTTSMHLITLSSRHPPITSLPMPTKSRYLRGMRSNVAFMVHDSLVIDLHKNDKRELSNIIRLFQDTKLGHFKTNVKIGKNLGKMESVEW